MSKKKNYQQTINFNYTKAPESLEDHVFYGLTLDEDQKAYRDAIWDDDTNIVVYNSKSGTGKTTIAMAVANLLVQYGRYNGILYSISNSRAKTRISSWRFRREICTLYGAIN